MVLGRGGLVVAEHVKGVFAGMEPALASLSLVGLVLLALLVLEVTARHILVEALIGDNLIH
jgi:hypothetical protein